MKFAIIVFCFSVFMYGQIIKEGKYVSLNGGSLLLKNKNFNYVNATKKGMVYDELEKSCGTYEVKNNVLLLTSNKLLEKCPDSIMKFRIKVEEIYNNDIFRKNLDSINLEFENTEFFSDFYDIYLCNTGIELLMNQNSLKDADTYSCVLIKKNKIRLPLFKNFSISLFPNYENSISRSNFIFGRFDKGLPIVSSEILKKEFMSSNLIINIIFDPRNYRYTKFYKEIFLFQDNKIIHGGEEYIYQEDKKEHKNK